MIKQIILLISIFCFTACKGQTKVKPNTINKETVSYNSENKSANNSQNSIDYIHKNLNQIYPLNASKLENYEFYDIIESAKVDMYENKIIREISCEGTVYRISKFDLVEYFLVPTDNCTQYQTHIIIKRKNNVELKMISGTQPTVDGSNSYYSYDFVLNKDYLELETTLIAGRVEISKETNKYKLTNQGLVKQ